MRGGGFPVEGDVEPVIGQQAAGPLPSPAPPGRGGPPLPGTRARRTSRPPYRAAWLVRPARYAAAPARADRRTAGGSGTSIAARPVRPRRPPPARASAKSAPHQIPRSAGQPAGHSPAQARRSATGAVAPPRSAARGPRRADIRPPCARCRRTRPRTVPDRGARSVTAPLAAARPPSPPSARAAGPELIPTAAPRRRRRAPAPRRGRTGDWPRGSRSARLPVAAGAGPSADYAGWRARIAARPARA